MDDVEGTFSGLFNPAYSFDSQTCNWKSGHGRHWYMQNERYNEG